MLHSEFIEIRIILESQIGHRQQKNDEFWIK